MTISTYKFKVYTLMLFGFLILGAAGCNDDSGTSPSDGNDGYLKANGIRGGQLYDMFWATETGWSQTDTNLAAYKKSPDFFRCKQCHGWDLLGTTGGYISRAPKSTRPNVSSLNLRSITESKTPQQIFDALKRSTGRRTITADISASTTGDQMPDYGSIFTGDQIWDMVKFLKEEALDTSELYDSQTTGTYPSGSIAFSNIGKDGNADKGNAIYTAKCASCHGTDGRAILVDGASFTVGSHLRAKPYEDQHKIKFGQIGSPMGSLLTKTEEMKDLYKALVDKTTYPDPQ